jgi:hypothetical protein
MMNKKQNTERQTRKAQNAECENAVSLRHGLGYNLLNTIFFKSLKLTNSVLTWASP